MPKKPAPAGTLTMRIIHGSPALPTLIRRLKPRSLARMISGVGLNDAAQIMALAPARTLLQAMDAAVWKIPKPGAAEAFDRREFVDWLEVWNEIGDEFTAQRLSSMSDSYLALCLSAVLRVASSSVAGFELDHADPAAAIYGSYVVASAAEEQWDVIRCSLDALWLHAPDCLLHLLGQLFTGESMLAADFRRSSLNLDVEFERERFQERRGFVPALSARAFLATAATMTMQELLDLPGYDLETRRHLASLNGDGDDLSPVLDAQFHAQNEESTASTEVVEFGMMESPQLAELQAALEDAGILEPGNQHRLTQDASPNQTLVVESLARLAAENEAQFHARGRELAFLASVLMTAVSHGGVGLEGPTARSAALSTCNLGLEMLRARRADLALAREPGLIRPFLIGWRVLASLPARVVEAFTSSLSRQDAADWLRRNPWSSEQAQIGVQDLTQAVARREFCAAREAATFLSFTFDPATCRAVLPLLDELPRFALNPQAEANAIFIDSPAQVRRIGLLLKGIEIKRRK